VALSASPRQSLTTLPRRADGFVLGYRTAGSAWRHMYVLCTLADVTARGRHALRHTAGTRLSAEPHDLEATARPLGHTKLETTRIHAGGAYHMVCSSSWCWRRPFTASAGATLEASGLERMLGETRAVRARSSILVYP
jgi:hypothetical protein